jgi:uncharacterized damage-inducible protein DinB
MPDQPTNAAYFYQGWETYQGLLIKSLAPLTPEQLALRSREGLRSAGENARHIIGARGRWFHILMGLGDEEFIAMSEWDRPGEPERTSTELVHGLEHTWQIMHATLKSWSPADLAYDYPNVRPDPSDPHDPESFTRQWVIWHLIEHDVFHGGEISQILGANGVTGMDL